MSSGVTHDAPALSQPAGPHVLRWARRAAIGAAQRGMTHDDVAALLSALAERLSKHAAKHAASSHSAREGGEFGGERAGEQGEARLPPLPGVWTPLPEADAGGARGIASAKAIARRVAVATGSDPDEAAGEAEAAVARGASVLEASLSGVGSTVREVVAGTVAAFHALEQMRIADGDSAPDEEQATGEEVEEGDDDVAGEDEARVTALAAAGLAAAKVAKVGATVR